MKPDRKRFTYSNVVATTALVVALTMTPVGAHVTTEFGHLWKGHIRPRLATAGDINAKKNPVHWTRLKKVPKTIADGRDDVVGYARIIPTGEGSTSTIVPELSKRVKQSHLVVVDNVHCFKGLPFKPRSVAATLGGNGVGFADTIRAFVGTGFSCPEGTQAIVHIQNAGVGGNFGGRAFTVWFN